ncbi:MAG: S-adenosylmethionine:tRNA ribosyltransferase-isomerase [Reichenbachiella sp.]
MSTLPDSLEPYNYELPEDRIAKHPLANREDSKLLVYENGNISHHEFKNIHDQIPKNATLFLNNTKVIAARLYFFKSTGARIEVFLTEPIHPHKEIVQALKTTNKCVWKCIIGNLKKWKGDEILSMELDHFQLTASIKNRETGEVEFSWPGDFEFLEVIESAGHVPLPPYMNRPDEDTDKNRYQTVFSELEGAVAAPTAGLHFTEEILHGLTKKGIKQDTLTLHVSAGTFRPIKSENFQNHEMHNEQIIIHRRNIENILNSEGPIVAVGTTALRTLESMFWYGVKLLENDQAPFFIKQNDPYELKQSKSLKDSLQAVLKRMAFLEVDSIKGETEIFIYPGYKFRIVECLSTNFHMPGSTLILLVAAFVGDKWKEIYCEALEKDYRFLSYGDTSFLLRNKNENNRT